MGTLVNGIKASMFGGVPGALVGGLILDKFLGVKQFREIQRDRDIDRVYRDTGGQVNMECTPPTWLGEGMVTNDTYTDYYTYNVSCRWVLSEEWVLATLILGLTAAFWVYRYLTKNG